MSRHRSAGAAAGAVLAAACATVPPVGSEESLRAVDAEERRIVSEADAAGLAAMAHPNLVINAPAGRVLTGEQLIARLRSGEVAAHRFERTPEVVRITGDIGVVMGSETFVPTAESELGRMFGARPLQRRYTNVYRFEGGRWRFLARHANVHGQEAAPK